MPFHPLSHLPWSESTLRRDVEVLESRLALKRVADTIDLYKMRTSGLPKALDVLAREGYLPARSLADIYGMPLIYQVTDDGYTLAARNARGEIDEDLVVTATEMGD